jgi:hypothetical protein
MTKYSKVNGKYLIKGKSYEMLTGSRAQVYHGTAYKTSGDLKKTDLIQNKHGRIVSSAKYKLSKQKGKNNLFNKGYTARKGKFGAVRNGVSIYNHRGTKHRRHKQSRRGGYHHNGGTDTATDPQPQVSQPTVAPESSFQPNEAVGGVAGNAALVGGSHLSRSRSASASRNRSRSRSLASRGGLFI